MTYPYAGRNLFESPESYSYADAVSADYVDQWRKSRHAFSEALASTRSFAAESETREPAAHSLCGILAAADGKPDEDVRIDPFVVKYEVFKRLFEFYGADGRRLAESPVATLSTYLAFAEALLRLARSGSLKHLSTLLKVTDALTSIAPSRYTPSEAQRLRAILAAENALLAGLEAA